MAPDIMERAEIEEGFGDLRRRIDQVRRIFGLNGHVEPEAVAQEWSQLKTLAQAAPELAEMAQDHVREKRLAAARALVLEATERAHAGSSRYRLRGWIRGLGSNTVDKLWLGLIAAAAWVAVQNAGPWVNALLGAVNHAGSHGGHPLH